MSVQFSAPKKEVGSFINVGKDSRPLFHSLTVVKVGGSLYDLPDLQSRLQTFLARRTGERLLLVPGGGLTADIVRTLDQCHGLGDEHAHWLALRALTLNAAFLAALLSNAAIVDHPDGAVADVTILDALAFAQWDERQNPTACLPHTWDATSDAVAARAAVVGGAVRLVLLKSVTIPHEMDWSEAGRRGFVDALFAGIVQHAPALVVEAINLRA